MNKQITSSETESDSSNEAENPPSVVDDDDNENLNNNNHNHNNTCENPDNPAECKPVEPIPLISLEELAM
jgi:hypothetical protein